jgi:hypothetical protein
MATSRNVLHCNVITVVIFCGTADLVLLKVAGINHLFFAEKE